MNIIVFRAHDNSSRRLARARRVQYGEKSAQRTNPQTRGSVCRKWREKMFFTTLLSCSNTFDVMRFNAFPSYCTVLCIICKYIYVPTLYMRALCKYIY